MLRREIMEEAGILVTPGSLLHAALVEVNGVQVMIVVHLCASDTEDHQVSLEHSELVWADFESMPTLELEAYEVAVAKARALLSAA